MVVNYRSKAVPSHAVKLPIGENIIVELLTSFPQYQQFTE